MCDPFNCQNVVKRQQIDNHSNLGINLGVIVTLIVNAYNWLLLVTHESVGRYAHTAKKKKTNLFYKRL